MQPQDVVDNRYRLIRVLGAGGFGTVWLAEETELGRRVALKFLHTTCERRAVLRFRREREALARLSHDHIMMLFGIGEHDGLPYLITQYIDGEPLSVWALSPRPVDEILSVATQIASALVAAHRAGIVHRDLKPSNIMIDGRNGAPFATVLDFGLAKLAGAKQVDVTKTGQVIGTPGFMSPEQLRADPVGPPSDLYNLGVILWELVERRKIFEGQSGIETCMKHLREAPPPLTEPVPSHIEQLVFRLLSKQPEARGRAIEAFDVLSGSSPPIPRPTAPRPPSAPPEPLPHGGLRILLGTVLLLVVLVIAFVRTTAHPEEPRPRRDATRAHALVEPTPEPQVERRDDVGTPSDQPTGPGGCGISWEPGEVLASSREVSRHTFVRLPRDDDRSIILIPANYQPAEPAPLVLVLHDAAQAPSGMLQEGRRLVELGGEVGAITVFAEGERLRTARNLLAAAGGNDPPIAAYPWPPSQVMQIPALIGVVRDAFCIDESRLYVIGHGRGAMGVERLLHTTHGFAASVQTSFRPKSKATLTQPNRRVPRLWLTPRDSPSLTDDGKRNACREGYDLKPYAELRDELLAIHDCNGDARQREVTGGSCETWRCEVPLVSCRTGGGRHWRDFEGAPSTCPEPISQFDHGDEIWKFFADVSLDRQVAIGGK